MANESKQNVSPNENDRRTRFLEKLISILDRYLNMFPQHKELVAFMQDEKQMYDADGKPSEQYQAWIHLFDEFCREHPFEITVDDFDSSQLEILKGANDFLRKQKELQQSYRASEDKEKWVQIVLDTPEKRDAFDKLMEESIKNELKSHTNS